MSDCDVAVIGGGVAGLSAAHRLSPDLEVVLFEGSPDLGGKLETAVLRDRPVDLGPDAFITRTPAAEQLCIELGLGEELLAPASNNVAIFSRQALRPLPKGIVLGVPTALGALWRSGVVPRRAVLRAATDLARRRDVLPVQGEAGDVSADPSVGEVFGPRLGRAVVETLIDPLLGGINASDAATLSLRAAAPQLAKRLEGRPSALRALRSEPATFRAPGAHPPFLGLSEGMAGLTRALADACRRDGVAICLDSSVRSIRPDGRSWVVSTDEGDTRARGLVLATPADATAGLLRDLDPAIVEGLTSIPYASVVTACFAWAEDAVPRSTTERLDALGIGADRSRVLPGSGVLIPRDGRRLVTGVSFTSTKWPRSANPGEVVVRAFAGRHADERAIELEDDALDERLLADLAEVLGITAPPLARVSHRWRRSLPQYVRGHVARVAEIERLAARHRTIALAGAAYHGIGVPACVASGTVAAQQVRAALGA